MTAPTTGLTRPNLGSVIGRIATTLSLPHMRGSVAALRRLDPADPAEPAFWRIAAAHLEPAGLLNWDTVNLAGEQRWAGILRAAADLVGLHHPGRPLGESLAIAGYHELRFTRLLRARNERLLHEVQQAARFLGVKASAVNVTDLAALVLSQRGAKAERLRRRIARSYYRHVD